VLLLPGDALPVVAPPDALPDVLALGLGLLGLELAVPPAFEPDIALLSWT
jgi:hypothetical protein